MRKLIAFVFLLLLVSGMAFAGQNTTKQLTITVNPAPAPLTITNTSLAPAYATFAYSQTMTATGGVAPYTWSISAGSLPPGLTLDPASGVISGTPITAGDYTFTVTLTDSMPATSGTAAVQVKTNITRSNIRPSTVR